MSYIFHVCVRRSLRRTQSLLLVISRNVLLADQHPQKPPFPTTAAAYAGFAAETMPFG